MFSAGWPWNPSLVAAAQTCSASDKQLLCWCRKAQTGGCATSAKQVAGGTSEKNTKERPLPEVVDELRDKVIEAAQQLQVELSGSAEQPAASNVGQPGPMDTAVQLATPLRNAEQPATSLRLKISSIRDVQRWLAEEHVASWRSVGAQRIREAVAVLAHPKPRQEDVRPLQDKWQVAQKKK